MQILQYSSKGNECIELLPRGCFSNDPKLLPGSACKYYDKRT